MKLPDANVWLAIALSKHVHHDVALAWFTSQSGEGSILFCRQTQQALLRLLTNAGMMLQYGNPAMSNSEAWAYYERLCKDPRVAFEPEPRGTEAKWKELSRRRTPSTKLWMDAYLAALAISGGHQLITADKAFSQFNGLDLLILS